MNVNVYLVQANGPLNNIFIAEQLKTSAIDLLISENRKAHKTDDYDFQQLIIRRGQVFDVTVTFNRDYRHGDDVILVQLATGK